METTIEQLRAKAKCMMSGLKAHPEKEGVWQATVNFSSYSVLYKTVADLMRVCMAVKQSEVNVSRLGGDPDIDLENIMELALQLLPKEEPGFLDEVRAVLDGVAEERASEVPEYNYSTSVVVED